MQDDDAAAIAALTRVGCRYMPGLTMDIESPSVGSLRRLFGVFGQTLGIPSALEDPCLANVVVPILERQVDAAGRAALVEGSQTHTPMSAQLVRLLAPLLWERKLHLPWTFKPMNLDFAERLQAESARRPVGFQVFYNRVCDIQPSGRFVQLGSLFPLPVTGSTQGTLPQGLEPGRVQLEAALVVEANVRV